MSLFAAGFAAALWIVAPSNAAELNSRGKATAGVAGVRTASGPRRHHRRGWPRYRVASWYTSHLRYADAPSAGWRGYYWKPRPVLLMVGIAF
jgi:hypothetical protein